MSTVFLAAGSIFDPIYNALGWALAFFYSLIPNLGVAIILLTVTIMLILYPLTAKQAKSMIAMQRLQPELKKLQAKYKGDRQKINDEMMKLYQENKVNPLAGCLPLLIQMPIFFALFRVLKDAYKHVPTDSSLYDALCTKAGHVLSVGACGNRGVNHLTFLGMDLQKSATDPHGDLIQALPYFLLVGLVMVTGYLQSRQAQKRTPQANKQMGMIMKVLPVFFGLISLSFPAGLVLYFFVSNLWRLGQQEVIFRRHGSASSPSSGKSAAIDVASTDQSPRKGLFARALGGAEPETGPDATEDVDPGTADPPPSAKAQASTPVERVPAGGAPRGGLRGLFQLPPPPGNGGTPPPVPGKGSTSSSSSPGGRAAQPRKRSNKKKRKR